MHYFIKCWEHYADFKGRARRAEFWWFFLFNAIIGGVLGSLSAWNENLSLSLSGAYSLLSLIPSLAVSVRRLHDVNKSGWFYLINLIPLFGWIWYFIMTITSGNVGPNEYGEDPKAIED